MTRPRLAPAWRDWSVSRRLTVLLVVFTLIPLGGAILYDTLVGRERVVDAALSRHAARAAATSGAIEAYMRSVLADVRLIAQSPPAARILLDPDSPAVQDALGRWVGQARQIENYAGLFIANQTGGVVVGSEASLAGRRYLAAPFFQKAIAGQTIADGPRYDPADETVYLNFASPIRSTAGVLLGVVVARITMEPIERIVAADTNFGGADEFGVLWDERGIRLGGSPRVGPPLTPFARLAPPVMAQLVAEQRFGPRTAEWLDRGDDQAGLVRRSALRLYDAERTDPHVAMTSGGVRLLVTIAPLPERRWLYGVFAPERAVLAGATIGVERLAALGLALVVLIVGAAALTARAVSRPVRALAETALAVAAGDRDRRARVAQGGELGQLGRTFDAMLDAQAAADAELRRYAEDLERMVEARTAALRASEERFQQAQKMEALGRLAGGVAHDFNNLLTIILGNAGMLREELASHAAVQRVREIEYAGDSAAGLARQLLAFSRRHVVQPKVLDLGVTIDQMRSMLQRLIREDIGLSVEHGPEPLLVLIDPGQVEQVIINLAVNARDAMPGGGRLTIGARSVDLDEAAASRLGDLRAGRYVVLTVSDTGSGIPPDALPHIFEPFFTTKPKAQGTGLGLATVHGIVAQGGGEVSVETAEGRGTTFSCYLPAVDAQAAAGAAGGAAQTAPAADGRGFETVLLVEDEPSLRAVAAQMLTRSGYTPIVARDVDEALRIADTHAGPIHLLLTDVVMPGMGGPELAHRIVSRHPRIRVVFMSGYTDKLPDEAARMVAQAGFLQKPFSGAALRSTVRATLDR